MTYSDMQPLLPLLAQAESSAPGGLLQFAPLILIFAGFYFLLIVPQRKKQKAHQKLLTELTVGDRVVTVGGIIGTITHVKKDLFQIKVDDDTRIELLKASVQSRWQPDEAKA